MEDTEDISEEELKRLLAEREAAIDKTEIVKPTKYKFMLVKINYTVLCVPYEDGLTIIKAMRNAEEVTSYSDYSDSNDKTKITSLTNSLITLKILSQEDYLKWKTRALLA